MVADLKKSALPEPGAKFNDDIRSSSQFANVTLKFVTSHILLLFIFLAAILRAIKTTTTNNSK